nr:DUF4169 family protein [Paracoccus sphaerophysae]
MAEITNLTRFRKARARAAKRRQGDENAALFGRTKAQKTAEDADRTRAARTLDQHRREDAAGDDAGDDAGDGGEDGADG